MPIPTPPHESRRTIEDQFTKRAVLALASGCASPESRLSGSWRASTIGHL